MIKVENSVRSPLHHEPRQTAARTPQGAGGIRLLGGSLTFRSTSVSILRECDFNGPTALHL